MEKSTQQIEKILDPIVELYNSMKNKLGSLRLPTRKCCIYKIPKFIRDGNEKFYRPSVISIGPIYYGDETPELETMKELKWIFLKRFLIHSKNAHRGNLLPFLNYVRQHEQEIRESYEQQISLEIGSKEFIEMIVLDAAFIIYWFGIGELSTIENYQVYLIKYIGQDLFVMENQLPFFVVKGMFDMAFGNINPPVSFIDVTLDYICDIHIPGGKAVIVGENVKTELSSAKHLLDFWRMFCCLNLNIPEKQKQHNPGQQRVFPKSAKQLYVAGVKFKASESKNPLEVKYDKGVLEIPRLMIENKTETLLRNIMFFEQCQLGGDTFFLNYIAFLDKLVDTVEDVQILVKEGIFDKWLESDEAVLRIFNNVTKGIVISHNNFYYSNISIEVNAYANSQMNQWKATLKTKYFHNPWAIISVIAAVILFLLTLLQTITGFTKN